MSEAQTPSDASVVEHEEEFEKDVVVTAYSNGEYENEREFMHDLFGEITDVDVTSSYEVEEKNVEITLSIEDEDDDGYESEFTESIKPYAGWKSEVVSNYFSKVDDEDIPDFLEITEEIETKTKHDHGVKTGLNKYLSDLFTGSELDEFGFNDQCYSFYTGSWSREFEDPSVDAEDGDTITQYCRVSNGSIDKRRPLVHQSERTRENRYQSEDELWSFQMKVHIECSTEDELEGISEALVAPLYDVLWGVDGVSGVRIESCEQSVSKRGECYNI